MTKEKQRKKKRPNPAPTTRKHHCELRKNECPAAKRPKEHKLHRQNNQGRRCQARTIGQENAGPGRERSPKEGRTLRNRTATPRQAPKEGTQARQTIGTWSNKRQGDKKSQTTHQGSPTTMELQRSAQKTATDHSAPPQRVQEEQSQQTLSQHHLRAPAAVQTVQPPQVQVTEGQKHTKPEN